MKKLLTLAILTVLCTSYSVAVEKKLLKNVDTDELTAETQVSLKGAGENHMAFAWWIPNEFWESVFSKDDTTSASDKEAILNAISGVSQLAVVQADITELGVFKFYPKEEIEKNMILSFSDTSDTDSKKQLLFPMHKLEPELKIILGVIKPILEAAMGDLGRNLHFYVLNDRTKASSRLLDPYRKGQINIQLAKRDNGLINASIELPINALFIPRKCPNGKDAHISWKYCPWTGIKLEE